MDIFLSSLGIGLIAVHVWSVMLLEWYHSLLMSFFGYLVRNATIVWLSDEYSFCLQQTFLLLVCWSFSKWNSDHAGSKDDVFFDSRAWLDSDCEDDFFSVNGGEKLMVLEFFRFYINLLLTY